jgi:adenylate cyclase
LDRLLAESRAGQGRVVFVSGDAGSGKTALLGEFVRRATTAHEEVVAAWGRCESNAGIGDPYLPFRDILLRLAGANGDEEPGDSTMPGQSCSRRTLPALVEALVEQGPDLIDLLVPRAVLRQGLARGAVAGQVPSGPSLDRLRAPLDGPVAGSASRKPSQTNLFEQMTRVLQTLAQQWVLILVLDDLQWADAASASLLFHLGRRLAGDRILIAGAYRPADVALGRRATGSLQERHPLAAVLHELQRRYGDIEIALQPEGRRFVDALLDTEPNRLGEPFRAALAGRTGGQPLFTVELLHSLRDQKGVVRDDAGRWVEGRPIDWDRLPARVKAVIAERVARLSPDCHALLTAASVQGQEFMAEVVARVLDVDDWEATQALSGPLCRQHRLVLPRGTSRTGEQPLSEYRFRHHLFQTYLYRSLDAIERARHHRATASALEALLGDQPGALEERAPHLARHCRQAGQTTKAIRYLELAARRSVRMSANQEALVQLEQALELLDTLPGTPERDAQEVALRMALHAPLVATESYGSARLERSHARMAALCEEMGDTPQLIPVCTALAGHYSLRAEFATSLAHAQKALALAERQGAVAYIVWARQVIGLNHLFQGNLAAAGDHIAAQLDADDSQHRAMRAVQGTDPRVVGYVWNAWISWLLGYPDQARQHTQSAVRLARKLDHTHSLAVALLIGAIAPAQMSRQLDGLPGWLEELDAVATADGIAYMQALTRLYRGWLSARREPGQGPVMVEPMGQALDEWLATGMKALEPLYLGMLADASLATGQRTQAQEALNVAVAIVEERHEEVIAAELHRIRGALLLAEDRDAEAEACLRRAIQVARRQQARSWELRATMSLARLLRQQGRREEARRGLGQIYGWFSEGLDSPDLQEAQGLLRKLTPPRDS